MAARQLHSEMGKNLFLLCVLLSLVACKKSSIDLPINDIGIKVDFRHYLLPNKAFSKYSFYYVHSTDSVNKNRIRIVNSYEHSADDKEIINEYSAYDNLGQLIMTKEMVVSAVECRMYDTEYYYYCEDNVKS
jgi:hypothetical protein